MKNISDI